jgi:mRNA-degrading endonuclease RelE of RelBE toxin-antitoxin system
VSRNRYRLRIARSAARAIAHTLPEKVAAAVHELITGPLLDHPHRIGKPLEPPLAPLWSARRGTYRVIHAINEAEQLVEVTAIRHRSDAYRG